MSGKDKWVRRFSVDETAKHKNGYTIYKITSVVFMVTLTAYWRVGRVLVCHQHLFPRGAPEAVTVVSVWKRYSEVRRLHRAMCALHAGLHLPARGGCSLPSASYFRRFQPEVVAERAKAIKQVLEFIAEHQLLFTSTEFVNFLQSGQPAPAPRASPPREPPADQPETRDETDFASIPKIPIYEAADVEIKPSHSSTESLTSLDSLHDDLYDELSKLSVQSKSAIKKTLPDLINFDAPSSSRLENYNQPRQSETSSLISSRSDSRVSLYSKTSLSNVDSKTKTEDSYVFEAGYLLNMAARCEDMGEYQRAFDFYKSGIEKMLIGVQSDSDAQRRALIKEKTNKYLSYAEEIYKNHLCNAEESEIPEPPPAQHCPVPLCMLRRPYEELSQYRVLGVLADTMMLVLHKTEQTCYAMKVIQKIPNNLTEFDEYFLQRTNETRQLVLPTSIPYMVPLQAYIETNSLIFLILAYAPGERLVDYIKNYVKSMPTTPSRVNLENVFSEPMKKTEEVEGSDEVEKLVRNSQTLLKNVDRALNEEAGEEGREGSDGGGEESPPYLTPAPARALPAGAARGWGAQLLLALDALHAAGVYCRDLHTSNVLLGAGGRALLTYCAGWPRAVSLARLSLALSRGAACAHVAPELLAAAAVTEPGDERLADYWGFGAVMYELLCGLPLSHYHRSVFTSHTVLVLPEEMPVEEESLLTQLLTFEPEQRLGRGGVDELKQHPYFRHVDWPRLQDWTPPG